MRHEDGRPSNYTGVHRYSPDHKWPRENKLPLSNEPPAQPRIEGQSHNLRLEEVGSVDARLDEAREAIARTYISRSQPEPFSEPIYFEGQPLPQRPRDPLMYPSQEREPEPPLPPITGPFAKTRQRWQSFKLEHPRTYKALQYANYIFDLSNQLLGHWYAPKPKWPGGPENRQRQRH
jgi:hypothetical protein